VDHGGSDRGLPLRTRARRIMIDDSPNSRVESDGVVPTLDTVLLTVTTTVERDLDARGAFPELRALSAQTLRGSSALHFATLNHAETVLADALRREPQVSKSLKLAYRAHIKSLQAAIAEAMDRPSIFAATEAVCMQRWDSRERWRGTKQQLLDHGIQLAGPWPHEPGGTTRWAKGKDARGYVTSITRHSPIWPGLYEAAISIPYEVWAPKASGESNEKRIEKARRALASMPKSVEEFQARVVEGMRRAVRFEVNWNSRESEYHGFCLADGVMERVDEVLDSLIEVLVDAQVDFDQGRQNAAEGRYRAEIAAADGSFQTKMADLLKPNPAILRGGDQ
jgi:hypothetical protein